MKKLNVFLDGKMMVVDKSFVDALTPGIVKGVGVFETMDVWDDGIGFLDEHFDRMFRGLRTMQIKSPYSRKKWEQALYQALRASRLRDARVRMSVWRDGKHVRMAIVCQEAARYSERKYRKGFSAIISSVHRLKTRHAHIKSLDYGCFRRAWEEAKVRKCDEAILLNRHKELVEGSRTNVFFSAKDVLYTPAIRCGALNGITRQKTMEYARNMGMTCRTVTIGVQKLFHAEEAFVTNSLMGIMPLTVVDGRLIGRGRPGPLTGKLIQAYRTNMHFSCPSRGKSV